MKIRIASRGCKIALLYKSIYMPLTIKEKQDYAWLLFKDGTLTQKAIAEKVGVSERTLSEWKTKNNWESKRRNLLTTRENILSDMYVIMENTKKYVMDKGGVAFSKDADALLKISAAIENLERELALSEIYQVGKKFIQYVQKVDFERAKEIVDYYDGFIKEHLKADRG